MPPKWTKEDWAAWRAENMRLTLDGWTLQTIYCADGTVQEWAFKRHEMLRRDPNWERDEANNYIYGAP